MEISSFILINCLQSLKSFYTLHTLVLLTFICFYVNNLNALLNEIIARCIEWYITRFLDRFLHSFVKKYRLIYDLLRKISEKNKKSSCILMRLSLLSNVYVALSYENLTENTTSNKQYLFVADSIRFHCHLHLNGRRPCLRIFLDWSRNCEWSLSELLFKLAQVQGLVMCAADAIILFPEKFHGMFKIKRWEESESHFHFDWCKCAAHKWLHLKGYCTYSRVKISIAVLRWENISNVQYFYASLYKFVNWNNQKFKLGFPVRIIQYLNYLLVIFTYFIIIRSKCSMFAFTSFCHIVAKKTFDQNSEWSAYFILHCILHDWWHLKLSISLE